MAIGLHTHELSGMAMSDFMGAAWPGVASKQFIVRSLLVLLLCQAVLFLYRGIRIRIKFRQLQAQGIAIPAPHSLLLGHLPLLKRIAGTLPKDASDAYPLRELVLDWRTHFPGADACPPLVYMDIWPLFSSPLIYINDPGLCQDLVSERFPPRHPLFKYLARATSGKRQLAEWDGAQHRLWRTRLNPGFSTKNLQTHISRGRLVDDVCVFVERLKGSAGPDGEWGEVFQMLPRAIGLTFDVICGVVLDFNPGEQTAGPTEMLSTLRQLIRDYMQLKSLLMLPKQLNPFWHLNYYRLHNKMRRILLPHIQRNLQADPSATKSPDGPKTVIYRALKEAPEVSSDSGPGAVGVSEDFVDDLLGLVKQFLFAGHDTTATALSFALHFLWRSPDTLRKLREEHDRVFGTDASRAPELLRESPHLLSSLPYTAGVVKETLRLTAIAASMRQSKPDFILRNHESGRIYPTDGSVLITGISTIHHHPDYWPRPTEFLPERWVVGEDDPLYPKASHAWRAFEWGPMSCIGQELAVVELKMALLFTVREVELKLALDEWDEKQGKKITKDRPMVWGDPVYQTIISPLGTPTADLPMRVKLVSGHWKEKEP